MENNLKKRDDKSNDKLLIEFLKKDNEKKDEEIHFLKENNQNSKEKKFISLDQMTCIYFTSIDQRINFPIPCIKSDVFAEIEEKLYQEYPQYRETNNYFVVNGTQILRFKTVEENKISNNMPVMLIVPEKDNNK